MSERTYSEDEMAALLERAAELQATAARANDRGNGLTLAELEAIAEEAGLQPAHLRQAAEEMDRVGPSLLGKNTSTTTTHIHVEQWVEGALTPEASEEVVAELRQRFDSDLGSLMGSGIYGSGTVEQVGRSLEWKHISALGIETRVHLRPRDEKVQVKLSQRVGLASTKVESIAYGMILAGILALILGAVLSSTDAGVFAFAAMLAAAIPSIGYADRKWRQKKHRELEALGDKVAELIAVHQGTGTKEAPVAATPATASVVLPGAEPEAETFTPARSRNRTA
jgi:tetrahydromethanopterin S-methyltransferase subunit F